METAIVRKYRVIPNSVYAPRHSWGLQSLGVSSVVSSVPQAYRPCLQALSSEEQTRGRAGGGESRGRGCPSRSPGRWPVQLSR